ncbi:MAG: TRAP transporter small permease [Rhodospirillaceae bacterium]
MTDRLFAWMDRLTLACALAGMAVLAVAMAVVLADIVMRSTVGIAVLGTVDITQLCVMACAFWAIPFAFMRAGHVRVEVGAERMPGRLRHGLDAVAAVVGAVFVGLIGVYGWQSAQLAHQYGDLSQTIGIPLAWYWATLLSGCALSVLATLTLAGRHAVMAVRGDA